MKTKVFAYLFVTVQMGALLFILATAPILSTSNWGILVEMTGIYIGVLAIVHMRIGNFNIAPLPKVGGHLVTTGLYKYIRHPMYLAQLLAAFPLVVDYFSNSRLIVWIVLLITLILKLHFEENKLKSIFSEYPNYMKKTWRLIPFIY